MATAPRYKLGSPDPEALPISRPDPLKAKRRKRLRSTAEVFDIREWRLPEKYRKGFRTSSGLDVSDIAMAKMTKGCNTTRWGL